MNETFKVEVSHATAEEFKSTEIGDVPNNNNENGDYLYDNFPELHSKEDEKDTREFCKQMMDIRHCGRSVFYVSTNLKKASSYSCKKIANNDGLLSFSRNSSYVKDIYDNADREMKMVDLVDSTVADGWVYVSAGWSKKERTPKQNEHQTIGLTCFQSNEELCEEEEANISYSRNNNSKMQPSKAKANRGRQKLQGSNSCTLFTVRGTRKLKANTENILMNFSLNDNNFSLTEVKKEFNTGTNVNTKECRDSSLLVQNKSKKHEKKSESLKLGLKQDEYFERSAKDKPQEREHAEHQYSNSKEDEEWYRRSLTLEVTTTENQFYKSTKSENKNFEEKKSLTLKKVELLEKNNNFAKAVNSSNKTKSLFRPSPMPRKQTMKPRPKPRTKSSTLLPIKTEQEKILSSDSCVKEQKYHENFELQSRWPATSNIDELLTKNRSCTTLNHMKPIPSPRQKPSSLSGALSPQYSSSVNNNSVEDTHEAKTKISLSATETNTQSSSPPPRPPKTHQNERQTSVDSKRKTSATNSMLKDKDGYLLPVNNCFLSEKLDTNFVCMIGGPPLLPRKPVIKKDNFSSPAKAKTLISDGRLPLKSKLLSTVPRLSGMILGQGPWYACRDITRESFISDCPLWPYEYVEDWLPPQKIDKNTSDKLTELHTEISNQNEPRHETTFAEENNESLSSDYVDMNSPPLWEESCYQIFDQEYEEVKFSPDKKGEEVNCYYEDIEVNIDSERNKGVEEYEEIGSP